MYIEQGLTPLHRQMGNLLAKIDKAFIDKFGIDSVILAIIIADYRFLGWVLEAKTAYHTYSKSWTDFGDHLVYDKDSKSLALLPTMPTMPVTPTVSTIGIRARFESFAQSIADNSNCTHDILVNLGIASDTATTNPAGTKPAAKVALEGGHPIISYTKGKYTGAQLYKDSGDGKGLVKFDKAIQSKYKDETPLPPAGTAVIWRYRLIFIKGNKETGDFSDWIEVTVTGI